MSFLSFVRRAPYLWGIAGMLLVALVVTWGAQLRAQQALRDTVDTRRTEVAEDALDTIEERFGALQRRLHLRAQQLAADSVLVRALQTASPPGRRPDGVAERVNRVSRDAPSALEVYDASGQVLAWNGPQIPRRGGPDTVPDRRRTRVVAEGDVRTALAVWHPVLDAQDRVVGAVRVVHVIRYQPPIQNRYIRGHSLEQSWADETGESVAVTWRPDTTAAPSSPHRWLRSRDGSVLARVVVEKPTAERLIQQTATFYGDWIALWTTLILLWVLGSGWRTYGIRVQRDNSLPALTKHAVTFLAIGGAWWGLRYVLLAWDVPARWTDDGGTFAPLFDPTHLASPVGAGLMRSTGDLLITGTFAVVFALGLLHLATQYRVSVDSIRGLFDQMQNRSPERPSPTRFSIVVVATAGLILGILPILATFVRRAVVDSTLDFFSRTGLLPQPLVLVVLCALFMLVVAAVLTGIALAWISIRLLLRYLPLRWPRGVPILVTALVWAVGLGGFYLVLEGGASVPFPVTMIFLGTVSTTAAFGLISAGRDTRHLTLRTLLPSILVLTFLLYPLLYTGMDAQRRENMVEAVASFEAGRDPRVLFSIEQVLQEARDDLGGPPDAGNRFRLAKMDSVATRLVRRSLLASLTAYEAHLSLLDSTGTVLYRYTAAGPEMQAPPSANDRRAFETLRPLSRIQGGRPVVEQLEAPVSSPSARTGRFLYAGLTRLNGFRTADAPPQWVLLRVVPRTLLPGVGTGIPRVLLPTGSFSDLYADLSLAEFRDGILARSLGRDFGRTQLPGRVRTGLAEEASLWRRETIQGRQFLTYYEQTDDPEASAQVVASRIPAVLTFDHLYYILRLAVAGLCVGALLYLFGVYVRYREGLLPAPRVQFRNKVLNAFLVVGIVSMVAVGVVGVQVVTSENARVTEQRLQDQLTRVEEALALEARPGEPLYQVAQRTDIDSLAARVGLDLRRYHSGMLRATSRPRLVRDRLVDRRLPAPVYGALHDEAYRFVVADASIGGFEYQVGYQALADAAGRPRVVMAVPTLAQQERIEEEQARTLAYLFGALLMLVVVVMLTALVLSNALARPIAQLREGLEAIGEGRFTRVLPVDSRDEIGDLVRTFNEMREQLAESRRKLAQQEREMAWREMARQVAHEIKNPLTPMKLSIQHLRRAFQRTKPQIDQAEKQDVQEFASMFDRITATLIEQIESLVRIANEFSSFARLPTKVLEPLDLNEVVEEAVRLMQEEDPDVTVSLDLHDEPLVVEADHEDLRRIYINLIKNAIQSIPDDRAGQIEVHTSTESNGRQASFARSLVVDNGTGIPRGERGKIFQPNFSTKTSGTGLGLAIAKKSIEELDGDIGFDTEEGHGTTFWIRLPLAENGADDDASSAS
jgi:signal transduction histidine kinase